MGGAQACRQPAEPAGAGPSVMGCSPARRARTAHLHRNSHLQEACEACEACEASGQSFSARHQQPGRQHSPSKVAGDTPLGVFRCGRGGGPQTPPSGVPGLRKPSVFFPRLIEIKSWESADRLVDLRRRQVSREGRQKGKLLREKARSWGASRKWGRHQRLQEGSWDYKHSLTPPC